MPTFFTVKDQWGVELTFKTEDIRYFTRNPNQDNITVTTLYDWRAFPISSDKFTQITGIPFVPTLPAE